MPLPSDAIWWHRSCQHIGSANGLLPDGTKPLPEPMLTHHRWGPVNVNWGHFHKKQCISRQLPKLDWKLLTYKFIKPRGQWVNPSSAGSVCVRVSNWTITITVGQRNKVTAVTFFRCPTVTVHVAGELWDLERKLPPFGHPQSGKIR